MVKFVHTSDWHIYDKHKYSSEGKRLEEIVANCGEIIEGAAGFGADRLIIAGDIFHHYNPSERLVKYFAALMVKAMSLGVKVRVIIGQHDTNGTDWSLQSLTTYLESVYQRIGRDLDEGGHSFFPDEYLKIYPGGSGFVEKIEDVNFYYVSWAPNAEELIKGIKVVEGEFNVLVAHAGILGAVTPSGHMMKRGYMDANALSKFDYVAMGDFHNSQTIAGNIHFCGAPMRFRWDERENDLGYNLIEMGEKPHIHRVPLTDIEMIQTTIAVKDINDDIALEIDGKKVKDAVLKIAVKGKLSDSKRVQLKAGLYEAGARQVYIKNEKQVISLEGDGVDVAGLSIIDMIEKQELDVPLKKYGVEIAAQI